MPRFAIASCVVRIEISTHLEKTKTKKKTEPERHLQVFMEQNLRNQMCSTFPTFQSHSLSTTQTLLTAIFLTSSWAVWVEKHGCIDQTKAWFTPELTHNTANTPKPLESHSTHRVASAESFSAQKRNVLLSIQSIQPLLNSHYSSQVSAASRRTQTT